MSEEESTPISQMQLSSREFKLMNNPIRRYYQKHYEFRYFLAMLHAQHIDLEGKRILDAGCGLGL